MSFMNCYRIIGVLFKECMSAQEINLFGHLNIVIQCYNVASSTISIF